VIVADGTRSMTRRLERVLTNDPLMGIFRHADAGYPEALETARLHECQIPMPQATGPAQPKTPQTV